MPARRDLVYQLMYDGGQRGREGGSDPGERGHICSCAYISSFIRVLYDNIKMLI